MNTINKDNIGSITLLAAMLITTVAALFSAATAEARTETTATSVAQVETIEVTATRLK